MTVPPIKFRETALEHYSSLSNLGQSINIVTTKPWLILLTVGLVILIIVVWGFLGRIPTYVLGSGILVEEKGKIYTANAASILSGTAYIKEILVQPGEKVQKGQILAKLDDSSLKSKIAVAENYVAYLEKEYRDLFQSFTQKKSSHQDNLSQLNAVLNRIIDTENKYLNFLTEVLEGKRELLKKGFATKLDLTSTMEEYYNTEYEIAQFQLSLIQNKINFDNFVDQWEDRLNNLELKLNGSKYDLNSLQQQLKTEAFIYSPINGIVISIQKSEGSVLKAGDEIISIAHGGRGIDVLAYISTPEVKRIKINMDALVSPDNVKREEYGSIKGTVIEVSSYPVTAEAMMAMLHNPDLVREFTKSGSPIAVRIRLQQDKNNYSGLKWTSSQGPKQIITAGTLATVRINVREQTPISLVIPAFKKLLRVE